MTTHTEAAVRPMVAPKRWKLWALTVLVIDADPAVRALAGQVNDTVPGQAPRRA